MEALGILEKKLADLVELTKKLKKENDEFIKKNDGLVQENLQLCERLELLESSVINQTDELKQEKQITKMVVDGLIQSIDNLIQNENG